MAQQLNSPRRAYTYADYLTWPEDERWEIIDGEAFDMTPAPGLDHQEMIYPADRIVTIFRLESGGIFGKPSYFDAEDRIDADLFPGLTVDLTLVFPPRPRVVRESPRPWGSESK